MLKNSIFGFAFSGAIVGWFIGLILGIVGAPVGGYLYHFAGSVGLTGIFGCLLGLLIGVIHPTIPERMHIRILARAMVRRLAPNSSDGLQIRSQTVASIWVLFLALVFLLPTLATGYDILLNRLQSEEMAAVASAFMGLAGFALVLALGTPTRAAVSRSLEVLIRRRPHFSFLVHPSGTLFLTLFIGAGLYLVSAPSTDKSQALKTADQIAHGLDQQQNVSTSSANPVGATPGTGDSERAPISSLLRFFSIANVALLLLLLFGEGFRDYLERLPVKWCFYLLAVGLFFSSACAVVGLRAPIARDALASGYSFSHFMISVLRLPFDGDSDGYSTVLGGGDCNDEDAAIHPGAKELYGNPVDENCDGLAPLVPDETREDKPMEASAEAFGFRAPYSIVLVSIDGMRPDRQGFFGYARVTTPAMDDLAAESIVFGHAYSTSSLMQLSLSAIMSGRYPSELKNNRQFFPTQSDQNQFLAEQLSALGYHTAGFPSHWYFGAQSGLEQGFNIWQPYVVEKSRMRVVPTAETVITSAVEHLSRLEPDPSRPYFMWLHLMDPMPNYLEHLDVPQFGTTQSDRYDHELRYVDTWLQWFIDTLKAREDWKRTVLIIVGTRGTDFKDEVFARLSQNNLHVPLMIRVPALPARQIMKPISLIDLMPTLLELAGMKSTEVENMTVPIKGKSLIPLFVGKPMSPSPIYSEILKTEKSSLNLAWLKWPLRLHFDGPKNLWSLYDVSKDPSESVNLAETQLEEMQKLKAEIQGFRSNFDYRGQELKQ